jgi:hypothetical protein
MAGYKIYRIMFQTGKILTITLLALCTASAYAQENLAKILVHAGAYDREMSLVSADLTGIPLAYGDKSLELFEIQNKKEVPIPAQIDIDGGIKLWWIIKEKLPKGSKREYVLNYGTKNMAKSQGVISVEYLNQNLIIKNNGTRVLQYNFVPTQLPEGISDIYDRAGYIHPLWSPGGEVLTRIQPPDHYHHVGIWNPWTQTQFKGKVIDYWNLNKTEGTVRPVNITSTTSNDLFGGFQAIHEHVDLNGATKYGYEVSLKEEWNVKVWNLDENAWVIDFTSKMNCATDSMFKILEYRYQGFGFRATEKWDDNTATLLTSEGKDKGDGNGTRARWCDVNGVSSQGTSGVLFITHPSNYNYPEPIRIWPTGANNGKENVFFNFNPAMDRAWDLYPGTNYQLKYRMYVYDGKISTDLAEKLWSDFAHPPIVTIEPVQQKNK